MSATRKNATPTGQEPRWLTLAEACRYTATSESIVRDASRNPEAAVPLVGLKVSTRGDMRFKTSDLDAWMEARAAWVESQERAS